MPGEVLQVRVIVDGSSGERPRLDVDVAIDAGLTAVTGPSGAGKSTLLLALAGLLRPRTERIVLQGETLFDVDTGVCVPPHRRRVGLVFQSLALFPHLTVWQNVAYGLVDHDKRQRAQVWLERMRVGPLAERLPSTLSGGEAQRVALARALAARPRLLLLDEPFSALDEPLRRELGALVKALVEEAGIPALLVTHDAGDTALSERVLRLQGGRLQ